MNCVGALHIIFINYRNAISDIFLVYIDRNIILEVSAYF